MKKIVYVLGFLFVAGMAMSTYASTIIVDNNTTTTVVNANDDEKPCPADCTCAKCEKAKADAKAAGTDAKVGCDKKAKADCDKSEKKACCGSKDAKSADTKAETPAEKK